MNVGVGFVDIVPKTTSFFGSLKKQMDTQLGAISKSAESQGAAISKGLSTAFIAAGALAIAGITKAIAATVEWGAEVRSLQKTTGQTAESASQLAAASAQFGLGIDQLNTGFGIFEKNIVNGAAGLTKYGLATKDAEGNLLPFDTLLGEAADKFVALGPGVEGTAFAMNVFGRSGKALIPILKQGSEGIDALKEKADELGLTMSQGDLDATFKLTLAQRELGEAFKGAEIAIGKGFLPAATTLINILTKVTEGIAKIPGPVLDLGLGFIALTGAVAGTFRVVEFFKGTWTTLLPILKAVGSSIKGVVGGLNTSIGALGAYAAAVTASAFALKALVDLQAEFSQHGDKFLEILQNPANPLTFAEKQLAVQQQLKNLADQANSTLHPFGSAAAMGELGALAAAWNRYTESLGATAQAQELAEKGVLSLEGSFTKFGTTLADFEKVSGQSTSGIVSALKLAKDELAKGGTANIDKVKEAVAGALTGAQGAWSAWTEQIHQSLSFVSTDLSKFSGKANVSLSSLKSALHNSIADTKAFGSALAAIAKSGPHGQDVANYIASLGPSYAGLAESMVNSHGKVAKSTVDLFSKALGAGQNFAKQIASALEPVFQKLIAKLTTIAKEIGAIPPVHIDTSQAQAALDALIAKAAQLKGSLGSSPQSGPHPRPPGHPVDPWGLGVQLPVLPSMAAASIVPLGSGGPLGGRDALTAAAIDRQTRLLIHALGRAGHLKIDDWRNGVASLSAELDYMDSTSGW